MTKFGKSDHTLVELMCEAANRAMADSKIGEVDAIYVGVMNSEEFTGDSNLASHIVEAFSLTGIPALRVETAFSAGAAAFHVAFQSIGSGYYRHVLVVGGREDDPSQHQRHHQNLWEPPTGNEPMLRANTTKAKIPIRDEGKIETLAVIYITPDGFLPPLALALIRDANGSLIIAQGEDTGPVSCS